jgi:uncharacterized protein (PEP-CTERM system associated)
MTKVAMSLSLAQSQAPSRVRRVLLHVDSPQWVGPMMAIALAGLSSSNSWGQAWAHDISVETRATGTTNATLAPNGQARADVVLEIGPRLRVSRHSADLDLTADAAVELVDFARNSQRSRALPRGTIAAQASLIPQLLFVDASFDLRQVEVDPFGVRTGELSTSNQRTQSSYRISPYIKSQLAPHTNAEARLEESDTRYGGAAAVDNHAQNLSFRVEQRPEPVGMTGEGSTQVVQYGKGANNELVIESFRGSLDRSLNGDGVVSVLAGLERTKLLLSSRTDIVYGARTHWSPSKRTELAAEFQHRFFGFGGELSLRHRTPFMSFSVTAQRKPVMTPSSLAVAPAGSSIRTYLDAALTTRYPDPTTRAAIVETLISSRGLQGTLPTASGVLADYAQLQSSIGATVMLLGTRDTLTFSGFAQTLRQLVREDDPISASAGAAGDNRQVTGKVEYSHRLTPQSSIDLSVSRSTVTGLGARAGDRTGETDWIATWVHDLSPRSVVTIGVQRVAVRTTVSTAWPYETHSSFVGLRHRF